MKIFDSHFSIIESNSLPTSNEQATPDRFTTSAYLKIASGLSIIGGAVVCHSTPRNNNKHLCDILNKLPSGFIGIAEITPMITDRELTELESAGVRAISYNLTEADSWPVEELPTLAKRIHTLYGWNVEINVNSSKLAALRPILSQLPAFSLNPSVLTRKNLPEIFNLVEQGMRLKTSGLHNLNLSDSEMGQALEEIHAINPNALLFGTNLPAKTRFNTDATYGSHLIRKIFAPKDAMKILCENAQQFYQIKNLVY